MISRSFAFIRGFTTYGLRLKPIDKVGNQARQQLNTWWKKNKRAIRKFIRETWEDWHIMERVGFPPEPLFRVLPQRDR